jgi:hypothetical protein
MAVHPATTPALAPRARLAPPRTSTSLAAASSSSCSRIVRFETSRLPLRSLRSIAAAAADADAVEAEEEEVQLAGGEEALYEEEPEEVMVSQTHQDSKITRLIRCLLQPIVQKNCRRVVFHWSLTNAQESQ